MTKTKVAVLGAGGMLGSMVLDVFSRDEQFSVLCTVRKSKDALLIKKEYKNITVKVLDAEKATKEQISKLLAGYKWIINAIGIIKPYIHDDNPEETMRALHVNAMFPHFLAQACLKNNSRILQIATDCVYSGTKGNYTEKDEHDATDVYGKTKSLGEAYYKNISHIRCSIIGPEKKNHLSLMDWFLGQTKNAKLNGFKNHLWNGVTTLHFAYICRAIIKNKIEIGHIQHVIPSGRITKADLLRQFAQNFNRSDVVINSVDAPKVIDRTLNTDNSALNKRIWQAAGYKTPPTVQKMVKELAEYKYQSKI
ncbi:MAG TPA: sugar nucleotide-binding protein [bacterium]|mgnify:CR=1 FL=1|nr:sugar nucleotide-binding protein [bacterium]